MGDGCSIMGCRAESFRRFGDIGLCAEHYARTRDKTIIRYRAEMLEGVP